MDDDVPEAYKDAADEIRAHLVTVRGGAPFLSSADARVLVGWLDGGVPVVDILRAIERMAESRRKARSRLPLTLTGAGRHLGRPTQGALPKVEPDRTHPLGPVVRALRAAGQPGIADALATVPTHDPDHLLRTALAEVRTFFLATWDAMPPGERARRLDAGRAAFAGELDGPDLERAAETAARDTLRAEYPLLTAATLWELVNA